MCLRVVLLIAALLLFGTAGDASADEAEPKKSEKSGVYWHDEWPRFSVAEGLISAAVTLRNNDVGGALDGPHDATFDLQVPVLDPGARALLRGSDPARRDSARRLSDLGFRTMVFAPYAIDVAFGTLALHRNVDVAAQLALIDFEVLTLAGMTQLLTSRLIGRGRPYTDDCPPGGCTAGPFRSFNSGHSMASFTAAGLMCVHHEMLPLFGGGAPDTWACIWALSVASATSTMRIVADEHWASDVLFGAGIGWIYGYYLPKLLHFHAKEVVEARSNGRHGGITWMPTFAGTTDSGTLGVLGVF